MPPNHFESEVESFLEGSHGDRTHIKRADHHTVTPLCGTLLAKVPPVSTSPPHRPAKATPVSTPHGHERAKATRVSTQTADRRATAPPVSLNKHRPDYSEPSCTRHTPSRAAHAKTLVHRALKRPFRSIFRSLGELFRAQDTATWRL